MSNINKQNPPELKSSFDIQKIVQTVEEIKKEINLIKLKKSNLLDIEIEISTRFPDFYDSHPYLVKKVCKGDDLTMLYEMLNKLDHVEKGNETLTAVETNLGSKLADKYLYPNLKKNNS
jgi:hypothetical protein